MSELADFFSQPIESQEPLAPEGQGLAEAFYKPVSVESEDEVGEIDLASLGQQLINSANERIEKSKAETPSLEQMSQEQGQENLMDGMQMLGQGAAAFTATPGPLPVKAVSSLAAMSPPVSRVVDATVDGTIKDGAAQLGTELGVNQETNLQENLDAARIAPSKMESIEPMKERGLGVDTEELLQSGIY